MSKMGELRCFCSRSPMLAKYGRNSGGLFVHVRIHKQSKIYGEFVFTSGTVRIRCRECLRWHKIRISDVPVVKVVEEDLPENVAQMLA